ncbi:Protein kinase-like domain [Pseudocohnilembus persalinus]|uniref:Protein kinase-like domain n=1 Tax=Pseudocohnilembus persalinus TaxID=266149 RepID=A0A0V0QU16_PSEPJ|nr:Protein kinase-like domain [Pseudocohnilembus persalinus]|eukprot:KRX05746.1 Protein kinase-like domain [Pseudocohnilembus persalinus]
MSKLREPGFYKQQRYYEVAWANTKKNQYDPYPHQRPGPDPNDKRQSDIKPDVKLRKFNQAAHTIINVNKIKWDEIRAVAVSEGGSKGVLFIENDDGAFVVKGSSDCAIEYYLHRLCNILKIPTPKMRVIKWNTPEFKEATQEIERAVFPDELLHYRVKPRIDMAYLLVMEYIPGIQIEGMGFDRAERIFSHLSPDSRDRLIRLGFILAFDTYINNYDRFPCGSIWENDGNPGNVICRATVQYTTKEEQLNDPKDQELQFQRFYAIDPRMSRYNVRQDATKEILQKYYQKVENFLNDVFQELKEIMENKIDPFFEQIDSKLTSIKKFTVDNIVTLNIDRVGQLFLNTFIDKKEDWQNYWNTNLEMVNIEVLADVLKIFTKFSSVYHDVINWLHDITLGEYRVNILDWEKQMGLFKGGQEEEEKQIESQYFNKSTLKKTKKTIQSKYTEQDDDSEDSDGDDNNSVKSKLTDEEYDNDDELARKINDLFYFNINQLKDDIKHGRDLQDYNKTTKQLKHEKPENYEF